MAVRVRGLMFLVVSQHLSATSTVNGYSAGEAGFQYGLQIPTQLACLCLACSCFCHGHFGDPHSMCLLLSFSEE